MNPIAVSTFLVALVLAAFSAQAVGQEFAPDDLSLESGESTGLLQPEAIVEPLPEPSSAPATKKHPQVIPLPPVETAESDNRLTLAEAEALATSFHPALREAAGRVRAAQGNWLQVGLRPNPEIGYVGDEMGDAGTAGKQGGFLSKEFVTAGKLGLNRAVALREVAAAQQREEMARLQILTTVRMQYFDVLAAERAVALARQLGGIAAKSVRVTELRLKALDIPRSSLLQSQIESESTALLEQQATERYDAAWRRLAATIGVIDTQAVVMDDAFARPLPELAWVSARERVLAESPELAELRFEVDRARYQVERASAGRVPNVNVLTGVEHDNVTDDTLAKVEVSIPLPVFDRNQGAIAQACGELAAAQAALRERELALEQRLASAMRDYATARKRAMTYAEKVLPAARESLDIINAGYQEGELDYLQVLTVQQTFAEKSLAYLEDLGIAWKQWAEIEGLLVGPLAEQAE
ncbi:MAG: TolC family protein [Planctomycetes bacterium]|nr:TolC family protein [Planctomycetota bacterium]